MIETRRRNHRLVDLLGTLITARDEESGRGMSNQQLHDEVLTLLSRDMTRWGPRVRSRHLLGNHPWELQEQAWWTSAAECIGEANADLRGYSQAPVRQGGTRKARSLSASLGIAA
ncbi:MAG: hypothetical protein U1D30_20905 [Planctomycetota bacterium]